MNFKALSDTRRAVLEDAATAVLHTVIKVDADWLGKATKGEVIAETLKQASAMLQAKRKGTL